MAQEVESTGLIEKLFSVEAVMMISFAVFIDAGEFFLELIPFAGQILSFLLDVIALIFISLWISTRSKKITVARKKSLTPGMKKIMKSAKKFKWLKPACMIFEMVPIFSSLAPLWIAAVLFELASD